MRYRIFASIQQLYFAHQSDVVLQLIHLAQQSHSLWWPSIPQSHTISDTSCIKYLPSASITLKISSATCFRVWYVLNTMCENFVSSYESIDLLCQQGESRQWEATCLLFGGASAALCCEVSSFQQKPYFIDAPTHCVSLGQETVQSQGLLWNVRSCCKNSAITGLPLFFVSTWRIMPSISCFDALTPSTFKAAIISGLSTVPPRSASRHVNTWPMRQSCSYLTQKGILADHLFHVFASFHVDHFFYVFTSFFQPAIHGSAVFKFLFCPILFAHLFLMFFCLCLHVLCWSVSK